MKKTNHIVSLVLCFVMLYSLSPVSSFAADKTQNYTCNPTISFSGAVDPTSEFVLTTPKGIFLADVKAHISIDGEPKPTVSSLGNEKFKITPTQPLKINTLYTVRLKMPNTDEISWVFQTMSEFRIVSTLPADESTGVPVNSGIELNFNYENFDDISKYFSIEPKVDGTFEKHGRTVVFIPKALKEKTVYTVTVKKGIKLNGSSFKTMSDFIFRFETKGKEAPTETGSGISMWYTKSHMEFATKQTPTLPLRILQVNTNTKKIINSKTTIYAFPSAEAYAKALENGNYYWSKYCDNNYIATDKLRQVLSFSTDLSKCNNLDYNEYYITFPQKLDAGFYVVETTVNNKKAQGLLQITDVSGFFQESYNRYLIWLNDIATGNPIEGAQIVDTSTDRTYLTDANGIADITDFDEQNPNEYHSYIITTKSKKQLVYRDYLYSEHYNTYWKYLELDRPMYQPNDTVSFWGYVKDKNNEKTFDSLTVELSDSYWWDCSDNNVPLVSQKLTVNQNTFNGKLTLPNLDPGEYSIVIKNGDEIINSSYILVNNYTKASYYLTATSNKKGVFEGDTVQFATKATFFDGTPVPNLAISTNITPDYMGDSIDHNTLKLDSNGTGKVSYKIPITDSINISYYTFNAIATLPETGEASCSVPIRVFCTKQFLSSDIIYNKDKPEISVKLQKIDLDKYNSSKDDDYFRFLGAPVSNSDVKITITRHYYKISEEKQYDDINKETYYDYEEAEAEVGTYSVKTGNDGIAKLPYALPTLASEEDWYTAKITAADPTGKTLEDTLYLPTEGHMDGWGESPDRDDYHLELQSKKTSDSDDVVLDIGESVSMQFKNRDELVQGKNFLYIRAQNGIRSYEVLNKPEYQYTFTKEDLPCVYLGGVVFDGLTYHNTYTYYSDMVSLRYDYELRRLKLDVKTDKKSYKPGEKCTISVTATDKSGKPRSGEVNISVVDEAFFALYDQNVDVLRDVYTAYVSDGVSCPNTTHNQFDPDGDGDGGGAGGGAGEYENSYERENFLDTAEFKTISLDQNGKGTYTFKLPDNLTTWRATISAITPDEYAETKTIPIRVSLPFFINFALGNTFLAGDKPTIGLTAYGDGVKSNEAVTFQVTSEKNKNFINSGKILALKRLDLPLWKLTEGDDTLTITATTASGNKDIIKHKITVISSHQDAETASSVPAKIGANIPHGTKGLTYLTFADQGRAALLSELYWMCHLYGNRIDQTIGRRLANDLLIKYGDEKTIEYAKKRAEQFTDFKISDYQCDDGGLSLFTYAESDLDLTITLLPIIKDEVNKARMLQYLHENTGNPKDAKSVPNAKALFGLALYREPVLVELNRAAQMDNISTIDLLYCALGYMALGDRNRATALYKERIAPSIEKLEPYYRIKENDKEKSAAASAVAAVLASQLNLPEREGLYQYAAENYTQDQFLAIEKLLYISGELPKKSAVTGEVCYSIYDKEHKITLTDGHTETIALPSANVPQLKINSVSGDVRILSIYRAPLQSTAQQTPDITVTRNYFVDGNLKKPVTSFHQGDIIRIEINVTLGEKALNGCYEVTDFLPAGLKVLSGDYRIAGNLIKFYHYYPYFNEKSQTFTYFARVQSPGEYTAEGVVVQSVDAPGVMKKTNNQKITIQ